MGSQVENLKIWQVGYQITEKFSEKFNESVKKIFWCAPTPQNSLCIVYYNSLKMNVVYSGFRVAHTTWTFNRAKNG